MLRDGRDRARARDDDRGHAPRRRDLGRELGREAGRERVRVFCGGATAYHTHRGFVPCDARGAQVHCSQGRLKCHFCSDFAPFFALRRGQLRFCETLVVRSRLNSTCVQQVMQLGTQSEAARASDLTSSAQRVSETAAKETSRRVVTPGIQIVLEKTRASK